jgi:hypothetical protein
VKKISNYEKTIKVDFIFGRLIFVAEWLAVRREQEKIAA